MRRYKSFSELEEEEVKGFVDLGFVFNKETISPRMMRVVLGCRDWRGRRRRGGGAGRGGDEGEDEEAVPGGGVGCQRAQQPPFSIAESADAPSSPTECADVKRNIRFWARSVASAVHQESS
ncbi:unnamed protein product [Spirodela intermedia]|uniref:Uncharacterized protein n=1 Tax=Spirodela intermedia TaxID=51605 RepID=A0A7I8IG83_SPIIN|nr:unnamed protein product [Spirodela intermedia]CAA6656879.1 unnamed protein product [Spirodela intermedia]